MRPPNFADQRSLVSTPPWRTAEIAIGACGDQLGSCAEPAEVALGRASWHCA